MGFRACRDREERADRGLDHQYDHASDDLLFGKITGGRDMLYELRIYHAVPGRLPDLLKRFDTITLGIWRKHGIEQAGFWTTGIGDSNQTLYYFLKWDSLADREKKWNAFQADPEWISARAETEKNGPIVARVENSILQPTNFSAVK